MIEMLIAVAWFTVLLGTSNILTYFYGITYQKHSPAFVSLFLSGVVGIWFTTSLSDNPTFLQPFGWLLVFVSVLSYVVFCSWWGRNFQMYQMYRVDTLSKSYHQLLLPNANSAFSKAGEILVQDVVLLVIVTQLLVMGYSYTTAGLIFVVFVLIIHIPLPYILGRIYGVWLTILATMFAVMTPWLIGEYAYGFYIVFAFHMFVYMLLLVVSRMMQKRFGQPKRMAP